MQFPDKRQDKVDWPLIILIAMCVLAVIFAAVMAGCGWIPLARGGQQAAGQQSEQEADVSPQTDTAVEPETDTGGASSTESQGDVRAEGDVTDTTSVSERTEVSADTTVNEKVSNLQQSLQQLKQQAQSLQSSMNEKFADEIGKMRDSIQKVSNTVNNFGISELRKQLEQDRLRWQRNERAAQAFMIAGILLIALVAKNVFPTWLTPFVWITGAGMLVASQLVPLLFSL